MWKGETMGLLGKDFDPLKDIQDAANAAGKGLGDATQGTADQAGRAAGELAKKAKDSIKGLGNVINRSSDSREIKHNEEFNDAGKSSAACREANPVNTIDVKAATAEALKEAAGKAVNTARDAGGAIGEGLSNVAKRAANTANAAITGAQGAASVASSKAAEIANGMKKGIEEANEKDPGELEFAVIEYNQTYTNLESEGISLYQSRLRSIDLLDLVTELVNSIANSPKSFSEDIEEMSHKKKGFRESESFAREELSSARKSAAGAGAGIAAGMAVASMAPSAAIWVATTFGTASTGTAISTLSGAAATNAAMAWLGGGALAAGGGGMATGSAFLAMAGPIGWGVAGATLLTSIALFTKKKHDIAKEKHKELVAVKQNTKTLRESLAAIGSLRAKTDSLRDCLSATFLASCRLQGSDYLALSDEEKLSLGSLVNNAKSLSHLLVEKAPIKDSEQK